MIAVPEQTLGAIPSNCRPRSRWSKPGNAKMTEVTRMTAPVIPSMKEMMLLFLEQRGRSLTTLHVFLQRGSQEGLRQNQGSVVAPVHDRSATCRLQLKPLFPRGYKLGRSQKPSGRGGTPRRREADRRVSVLARRIPKAQLCLPAHKTPLLERSRRLHQAGRQHLQLRAPLLHAPHLRAPPLRPHLRRLLALLLRLQRHLLLAQLPVAKERGLRQRVRAPLSRKRGPMLELRHPLTSMS